LTEAEEDHMRDVGQRLTLQNFHEFFHIEDEEGWRMVHQCTTVRAGPQNEEGNFKFALQNLTKIKRLKQKPCFECRFHL